MVKLVKFKDITKKELEIIINKHYTHWKQFNPALDWNETVDKFKNQFTKDEGIPIGYACYNDDILVGFCALRKENLKKYPEIYPWISSVMIFEEYRHQGYGTKMLQEIANKAKELGYNKVYLWTDQAPEFYKKIGYTYLQQVEKNEGGYGELFYKEVDQ